MRPIPVPMRRRILQLYERGKGTREIAEFFGFCVAAIRRVRQQFRQRGTLEPRTHLSGRRTLLTKERKLRLQELQGAETAVARVAVQATRRHAGRVGRAPGPALPDFHDRCMASATGLEV